MLLLSKHMGENKKTKNVVHDLLILFNILGGENLSAEQPNDNLERKKNREKPERKTIEC